MAPLRLASPTTNNRPAKTAASATLGLGCALLLLMGGQGCSDATGQSDSSVLDQDAQHDAGRQEDAGGNRKDAASDLSHSGDMGSEDALGDGAQPGPGQDASPDTSAGGVAPTVELIESAGLPQPHPASEPLTLAWKATDPDSVARVSLFYDRDQQDANGKRIVANIAEDNRAGPYTYAWQDPVPGTHYLYAKVDDGSQSAVDYGSHPVDVYNVKFVNSRTSECAGYMGQGAFTFGMSGSFVELRWLLANDTWTGDSVGAPGSGSTILACRYRAQSGSGKLVALTKNGSTFRLHRLQFVWPSWEKTNVLIDSATGIADSAGAPAVDLHQLDTGVCWVSDQGAVHLSTLPDGGSWSTETVAVSGADTSAGCRLRYTSAGQLFVAYRANLSSPDRSVLRVVERDADTGVWTGKTVAEIDPQSALASLAIDRNGHPAVSYVTPAGRAAVSRTTGTSWTAKLLSNPNAPTMNPASERVAHTSIAITQSNGATVSYWSTTGLFYAYEEQGQWLFYSIHSAPAPAVASSQLDHGGGATDPWIVNRHQSARVRRIDRSPQ